MAGDWTTGPGTDLADLLTPFAERLANLVPKPLQKLRGLVDDRLPHHERNSIEGSRSNIERHYDLSNDLFAEFLDPSMTYSSAWFADEPGGGAGHGGIGRSRWSPRRNARWTASSTRPASVAGTRMLEIGSGWGVARRSCRAARRARHHDHDLAGAGGTRPREVRRRRAGRRVTDRPAAPRLPRDPGRVRRDRQRRDDRGRRRGVLADLLPHHRPAPRARRQGLHPGDPHGPPPLPGHAELLRLDPEVHLPRRAAPVAAKPSTAPSRSTPASPSPSVVRSGRHYARTLRMWRDRFDANWPAINAQGFDETFRRMWEFYLAYCEAGFTTGYIDVVQLQMQRPAETGCTDGLGLAAPEADPGVVRLAVPRRLPRGRPRDVLLPRVRARPAPARPRGRREVALLPLPRRRRSACATPSTSASPTASGVASTPPSASTSSARRVSKSSIVVSIRLGRRRPRPTQPPVVE